MEGSKSVLIIAPSDRKFRVDIKSNSSQSDLELTKISFQDICLQDFALKQIVDSPESHFIFKKFDPLFKCEVEITNKDVIEHGSVLNVTIISSVLANLSKLPGTSSANDNETLSKTKETILRIPENQASTSKPSLNIQPANQKEYFIKYPFALPSFSPALKKAIAEGNVHYKYNLFVRECANALLSLKERPSKADYESFCQIVSEKYPFCKDKSIAGGPSYFSFKKMLTSSIRNSRNYSIRGKKRGKREEKEFPSAFVEVMVQKDTEIDAEFHVKELQEALSKRNIDALHVENLMEKTRNHRQQFIKTSSCIRDVQNTYPALKVAEWIISDYNFYSKTNVAIRNECFKVCVSKLLKLFDVEDELELFKKMEKEVSPKKFMSCFLILKVGDIPIVECHADQAPFAVIYLSDENKISESLILAQQGIVCKVQEEESEEAITFFNVIDTLMATYYAFDYCYPKAYKAFFTFCDFVLLQKAVEKKMSTSRLFMFIQKYNYM